MPLEILTIPCLKDNYAFLIHDPDSGDTALVDAPEAAPVLTVMSSRGWVLTHVFLTHHHWDHVDALPDILAGQPEGVKPLIIGAAADAHRLPALDIQVAEGDRFQFGNQEVRVFDVSGHTVGHIAFYMPGANAVFTADSLMALGCGRLFEGTPEQMWDSLSKLASLPRETVVYSGHEYTQSNATFALTIEPQNPALQARIKDIAAARADDRPTVPSLLGVELDTNPFLRAGEASLQQAIGMTGATPAAVFTEIRLRKDNF